MHRGHKSIVWFNEVTKKDIPLVSVSPDMIDTTREIIARAEKRLKT